MNAVPLILDLSGSFTRLENPRDDHFIVYLLLLVLGIVLGCFALFLYLIYRSHRPGTPPGALPARHRSQPHRAALVLNTPQRWLAVKTSNPQKVQTALDLHNPIPCSWDEGVEDASERRLFISPPVNGWVLVIGSILPDPAHDVDCCFHFLRALSAKVGHVQFFSANRVLSSHAWIQLCQGRVLRAYAWADRTLWNQGPVTRAETELDLICLDYSQVDPPDFLLAQALRANTDKVPQLASRWSIDPTAIDSASIPQSSGIVGELSHFKPK